MSFDDAIRTLLRAGVATTLALSVSACGDDEDEDHEHEHEHEGEHEESPASHACIHLAGGPDQDVTAGDSTDSAPDVSTEHTRFDVALMDMGDGTFGGMVTYNSAEATDYIVAFNADVTPSIMDATGAAVSPESGPTADADACAELHHYFIVEMGVGQYTLDLSAGSAEVQMVIEEYGHEHEGEHMHEEGEHEHEGEHAHE